MLSDQNGAVPYDISNMTWEGHHVYLYKDKEGWKVKSTLTAHSGRPWVVVDFVSKNYWPYEVKPLHYRIEDLKTYVTLVPGYGQKDWIEHLNTLQAQLMGREALSEHQKTLIRSLILKYERES